MPPAAEALRHRNTGKPHPTTKRPLKMLHLSHLMIAHQEIDSFGQLLALVGQCARQGERFIQLDVKPAYPDTPDDWEDRVEATFSGRL